MWCRLCKTKFDKKSFKEHFTKKHRLAVDYYEDDSESENSEQDEVDDESDADIQNSFSITRCNRDITHASSSKVNTGTKTRKYQFYNKKFRYGRKHSRVPSKRKTISFKPVCKKEQLCAEQLAIQQEKSECKSVQDEFPESAFSCIPDQLPLPNIKGGFVFNSRNILIWLLQFKEMNKKFKYPLHPRLFEKITLIHKQIFAHYCCASSSELTSSVMKVYEELDYMINKQILSVNESLK